MGQGGEAQKENILPVVESKAGAVAVGAGSGRGPAAFAVPVPQSVPWRRFLFPLIEPDVRISRIRLSDRFHVRLTEEGFTSSVSNRRTPRVPKTSAAEKRRVPRVGTLCRRCRKRRVRLQTCWSTSW